jgi:hypothetical protein
VTDGLSAVQTILAGVATGPLAVLGIAAVRSRLTLDARVAAVLCLTGVATYAVASLPDVGATLAAAPLLAAAVSSLVCGTIGFYAVTARAVFEDKRTGILEVWPPALLILLWLGALRTSGPLSAVLIALYLALAATVLVHVTRLALRGRAGDLVESRRRLRRPVAALTLVLCLAALLDIAVSTATRSGLLRGWMTLEREAGLAALAVAAASMLLAPRPPLARGAGGPSGADDPSTRAFADGWTSNRPGARKV